MRVHEKRKETLNEVIDAPGLGMRVIHVARVDRIHIAYCLYCGKDLWHEESEPRDPIKAGDTLIRAHLTGIQRGPEYLHRLPCSKYMEALHAQQGRQGPGPQPDPSPGRGEGGPLDDPGGQPAPTGTPGGPGAGGAEGAVPTRGAGETAGATAGGAE